MNEALLLMGCVILLCTLMGRYLDRLADRPWDVLWRKRPAPNSL